MDKCIKNVSVRKSARKPRNHVRKPYNVRSTPKSFSVDPAEVEPFIKESLDVSVPQSALDEHSQNSGTPSTVGGELFPGSVNHRVVESTSVKPFSGEFLEVMKKPSRVDIINWSSSSPQGALIASIPISPLTCNRPSTIVRTTNMAHYAPNFKFWRGGMHVQLEVISNKFYQGQLYAVFVAKRHASSWTPAIVSMDQAFNSNGVTLNISEENQTNLHVPYVHVKDYLRLKVNTATYADDSEITGYVNIYVLNPLIVGTNMPANVDVNVDLAAADDLEYDYPVNNTVLTYYDGSENASTADRDIYYEQAANVDKPVKDKVCDYPGVVNRKVDLNASSKPMESFETATYMSTNRTFILGTTTPIGTKNTWSLPTIFFDNQQIPSDVFKYHALFSSDFEIGVRIQSTPFHKGKLVIAFDPTRIGNLTDSQKNDLDHRYYSTIRNLPHCEINLSSQTEGTFYVPFASIVRNLLGSFHSNPGSFQDFGQIVVYVYNQLGVATNGSPLLSGIVTIKCVKPYYLVRQPIPQMIGNHVGELKELCDTAVCTTEYKFVKSGQDHNPIHTCHCVVSTPTKVFVAEGSGLTKQDAKQAAAYVALQELEKSVPQMNSEATDDAKHDIDTPIIISEALVEKSSGGSYMTKKNHINQVLQSADVTAQATVYTNAGPGVLLEGFRQLGPIQRRFISNFAFYSGDIDFEIASTNVGVVYGSGGDTFLATPASAAAFVAYQAVDASQARVVAKTTGAPRWTSEGQPTEITTPVALKSNIFQEMSSTPHITWNPIVESRKVIKTPQISSFPILRTNRLVGTNLEESYAGTVTVGILNAFAGASCVYVATRAGKGYALHYLITPPVWYVPTPPPPPDVGTTNKILLKQAGDVEENPGPVVQGEAVIRIPQGMTKEECVEECRKVLEAMIELDARKTIEAPLSEEEKADQARGVTKTIENIEYIYELGGKKFRTTVEISRVFAKVGQNNYDLLIRSGDVESNPGPDQDPTGQSSLVSQLLDFLVGMARTAGQSTVNFITSLLDMFKDNLRLVAKFLIKKGVQAMIGPCSELAIELVETEIVKALEYLVPILQDMYVVTWFCRKCYLLYKGEYSYPDLISDVVLMLSTDTAKRVWNEVQGLLQQPVAQMKIDNMDSFLKLLISTLGALVFGIFGLSFSKKKGSVVDIIMTRMIGETGKSIQVVVSKAFEMIYDYFMNGTPENECDLTKFKEIVPVMLTDFYKLKSENFFQGASINAHHEDTDHPLVVLTRMRNIVDELMPKIVNDSKQSIWLKWCQDVLAEWNTLRKNQVIGNTRPEPIGIYLYGEPGQGKSYISTTLLPEIILSKLGVVKDRSRAKFNVYNFPNNPDQAYADGYWGQPFVVYDDLGAMREGKDYQQMINFISSAVAPINMADLKDKGQLFISNFVCATTNQPGIMNVQSITNPEAIVRRFPFAVKMSVRAEYARNGKLNMTKMNEELALCTNFTMELALYDRVFKFEKLDIAVGQAGEEIPFSRLTEEIVAEFINKRRTGQTNNELREGIPIPATAQANVIGATNSAIKTILRNTFLNGDMDQCRKQLMQLLPSVDETVSVTEVVKTLVSVVGNGCVTSVNTFLAAVLKEIAKNPDSLIGYGFLARFFTLFESQVGQQVPYGIGEKCYPREDPTVQSQTLRDFFMNVCVTHLWNPSDSFVENLLWKGVYDFYLRSVVGKNQGMADTEANIAAMLSYLFDIGFFALWCLILYKLVMFLISYIFPTEEQAYDKTARKAPRTTRTPVVKRTPVNDYVAQANFENERVHNNCVELGVILESETPMGWAVVVNDHEIIINRHYVKHILKHGGEYFIAVKDPMGDKFRKLMMTLQKYVEILSPCGKPTDAVLVRLPFRIAGFRKLNSSLMPQKMYEDQFLGLNSTVMLKRGYSNGKSDIVGVSQRVINVELASSSSDGVSTLLAAKTQTPSEAGDCGTPYMVQNHMFGIHSAYNFYQNTANISVILAETLTAAQQKLANLAGDIVHVEYTPIPVEPQMHELWTSNENGFFMRGVAKRADGEEWKTFVPMGTSKVKALINDTTVWPDEHKPTVKSYEIMYNRCQKYQFPDDITPPTMMENQFVLDWWFHVLDCVEHPTGVLTDHEVWNGIGEEIMEMNRDSSAGVWNEISKGKKDLMDVTYDDEGKKVYSLSKYAYETKHPGYNMTFPEFIKWREDTMKKGFRINNVFWTTCMKDELKPSQKVDEGKTRIFECAPLDSTYLIKKYFGKFAGWYRTHAGPVLSHAIGLEKEKYWGVILEHLKRDGKTTGVDLDYKEWDGSVPPAAFQYFEKLINMYYHDQTEEEKNIRACLIHEIQYTQQLVGKYVCQSMKGNKSGMWLTDVFNSVVNHWLWMCVYHKLFFRTFGRRPELEDWENDCVLFTLGDDALASVQEEEQGWFNVPDIIDTMKSYGFTATPASKDESDMKYKPFSELQFLKSHFCEEDDSVVYAPMPKEISYREMNWVKREWKHSASVRTGMIRDALRFMAHHGEEEYNQFRKEIKAAIPREPQIGTDKSLFPPFSTIQSEIWLKQKLASTDNHFCHHTMSSI